MTQQPRFPTFLPTTFSSLLTFPPTSYSILAAQLSLVLGVFYIAAWIILRAVSPRPRKPILPDERRFVDLTKRRSGTASSSGRSGRGVANSDNTTDGDDSEEWAQFHDMGTPGNTLPAVSLTVVVPAYNEETRLPAMLQETHTYLSARQRRDSQFTAEIVVVDDGSRDATTRTAHKFGEQHPDIPLRVLTLRRNRGKGGAVAEGMRVARGAMVLFADADGASRFADVDALERELRRVSKGGEGAVVIGSRAHLVGTEAVVKRSFIRNFLMHSFHFILAMLGIRGIRDTQCGFKLFSRSAAQRIFSNMHVEGWIFDIEVLLLAQYMRIPIAEVPISWHEVDGSKMVLMKDSIKMLWDLCVIRGSYTLGVWRIRDQGSATRNAWQAVNGGLVDGALRSTDKADSITSSPPASPGKRRKGGSRNRSRSSSRSSTSSSPSRIISAKKQGVEDGRGTSSVVALPVAEANLRSRVRKLS